MVYVRKKFNKKSIIIIMFDKSYFYLQIEEKKSIIKEFSRYFKMVLNPLCFQNPQGSSS